MPIAGMGDVAAALPCRKESSGDDVQCLKSWITYPILSKSQIVSVVINTATKEESVPVDKAMGFEDIE
ncbi:hypothetical protein RJT34_11776 [Clitoria ternatea]|uniref:Uncharacterized protein n=1 Tax=Clitoria ternatea TaxID=43366 RepID=A0AAN9JL35_CLITE